MAVLKDPYQAGGIRGSIGGVTFSIHKGQITGRTRRKPSRRLRTTQPRNRSIFGYLSRNWGLLSDGDRVLWENYALNNPELNKFGQEFTMSGINAYIKLNSNVIRLLGFGEASDSPPIAEPVASIDSFTAVTGVTNPGDCDMDWLHFGAPIDDDYNELRIAGPFASKGRQEVFERKRYISISLGTIEEVTISGLAEGMWYWFYMRYISHAGQATNWLVAQATPMLTP